MNQPADIPVEVGGAAYRIAATSNIFYDPPQHPYSGGVLAEIAKYQQAMHQVPVYMAEDAPPQQTQVERVSGSKDVAPQPPAKVNKTNILNINVDEGPAGRTGEAPRGAIAADALQRARY